MGKLEEYLHSVKGPKTVMISPTDSCNLSCLMCWRLDKKNNPNLIKAELSFNEIKKGIEDSKRLNVERIDLTGGGEAFLRKDIFDVIRLIKKHGMKCSLTTNATLLSEEKIKRIIETKLDEICFSIESADKEINDRIRGKGTLEKSMKAIGRLNELKKSGMPIVRISTVITKINHLFLDSLVDYAIKNASAMNFSVLLEWESNRQISMRNENKKAVFDVLKNLEKKTNGKIYTNLPSLIRHGLFEHSPPAFCFAPWEMVFINSNGEVLACCTLASYYQNKIGNVKKESLIKIWNGKKMNEFRERIKKKEFFKECNRCIPEFVDIFNKTYESLK
jgi:radical SAM protein with 4Fe4S-binding SPASM domain